MCGLAGQISFGVKQVSRTQLKKMTEALAHRGPDGEGFWFSPDQKIGLGHRRLAIIDLSTGDQPMANEDRTVWLIFNGEIYNFKSLKKKLIKKGHRFKTKSDTEVIIHAWEEFGENCADYLEGMFAFGLWDQKKKKLFLARDRLGQKPLFYAWVGKTFLFASELKGLLVCPEIKREIDQVALAKYFVYGFVPAPLTIIKGVRKLLPGHFLVVEEKWKVREKKFWDYDYSRRLETDDKQAIKERVKKLFCQAVEKRLVADVPLGVFLSGGVDSSLVAAMMKKFIPSRKIEAFSIGFKERKVDESVYAKMVADHLGVKHYLKIFSDKEVLDLVPRLANFLDEPMADPSLLPTFLLSSFARRKVTVALSGDGGDESFAGYPKYLAHWFLEKSGLKALPFPFFSKFIPGKIGLFCRHAHFPLAWRNQLWVNHFPLPEAEKLVGKKVGLEEVEKYAQEFNGQEILDQAFFLDQKLTLADLYLVKTDRASMAASLEVRSPFLDQKLVEFCARIPFRLKMESLRTKSLLKEIALEFLPPEAVLRPKMGFGIPLSEWLKKELKELVAQKLARKEIEKIEFLNWPAVAEVLAQGSSIQVWDLLVFKLWWDRWFG